MKLRDHLLAIYERLGRVDANLAEHMRRTEASERRADAVEEQVEMLKTLVLPLKREHEAKQMQKKGFNRRLSTAVWAVMASLVTAAIVRLF